MERKYILTILILALAIAFCGSATAEQNNTTSTQSTTLTDTPTQNNSLQTNTQTPDTQTTSSTQDTTSNTAQTSGNTVYTNDAVTTTQGQFYQSTTFPTNYDLRTLGKVTSVKYQGTASVCWTFATFGSLESCLLPYESDDFSENNLKNLLSSSYTNGFDRNWSDGGSFKMALAYLARWSGPVNESRDPYNDSSGISPTNLGPIKHVQNAIILPARTGPLDNDNIKSALMNYGAIATAIYYDDIYYNSLTHSYYYSNSVTSTNHCINIMGWDDNYSSANFKTHPPGNGAFIIKNSWGTWWGENGYFYLSYYNTQLSELYVFNNAESTSNYNKNYQYDPLGWCGNVGFGFINQTGWFSNVFTSTGNDKLAAASFYVNSPNSNYELYVYLNPLTDNPTSGTLAATKTGILDSGYWTINLDTPIKLITGQIFSVVVKLHTPGYNYPIPVEHNIAGYTSQASSSPKQSYFSSNGINWSDLYWKYDISANVCLKAFTIPYIKVTSIDPANKAVNVAGNKTITVKFSEAIKAGSMWIDLKNSAGTLISYTTNIAGNVLTIKPTNLLTEGKYTLILHSGSITDLASYPLAVWSSSFTAGTPPKIISVDPVNKAVNVAASKVITVTFSEPIKTGSLWIDLKNSAGTTIPYTVSISSNVLTITPKSSLTENKYTLTLHSGSITDMVGNTIVIWSSSFSVGTSPIITTSNPLNNAINVARNKTITITFNEPIKSGNLWIDLKSSNGTSIPITFSISGSILTIKHTALLAANTNYILSLHSGCVTDTAGNPVTVSIRTFKTGSY